MIPDIQLQQIAADISAAQTDVRQIDSFSARYPAFDLESAYAVARIQHQQRLDQGATMVGRKIGFTNPAMWARFGVHQPLWAPLYQKTVAYIDQAEVACSLGGFTEPKIEPELVLHFHRTPPVTDDPAAILACVDWVAHAFEIVQSHYPNWEFSAADVVADDVLHGALLIGPPCNIAELGPGLIERLKTFSVALYAQGDLRETGEGRNVLGCPATAVAYLQQVLDQQPECSTLQAGELVTTGTITTALPVKAGETWETRISGLDVPGLKVRFTR
ncbi:MAG: fumarylacetoacetate hydrolase family protein [Pelovirga sp.]